MGTVLWLVCGVVALLLARIVPPGRPHGWIAESAVAVLAALILGVVSSQLDFGGWRELDWRAAMFALLGAFAMIGLLRVVRLVWGASGE